MPPLPEPPSTSRGERVRGPVRGLVLGAGGIRGCAHAGVMMALHEEGIEVDLVVGASVGSIFGLAVAAGVPADHVAHIVRESTPADLARFYAGRLRAGPGNPIARLIHEAGDGRTFADLSLPFAVTATDMETGRPVVIDRGPVLEAIEASIAVPFVARPVRIGDRCYVDGGLMNTVPVDVARAMGADRIIAVLLGVNYLAPGYLRRRPWTRIVMQRLGRQRGAVRGHLLDQLRFGFRLQAASYDIVRPGEDADIAIWPEFHGLSPNSMVGAQFCMDQGYRAAKEALAGESFDPAANVAPPMHY